jgi:hypothetical protein
MDGDKHYRLLVTLVDIIKSDPDVDADLQNNLVKAACRSDDDFPDINVIRLENRK